MARRAHVESSKSKQRSLSFKQNSLSSKQGRVLHKSDNALLDNRIKQHRRSSVSQAGTLVRQDTFYVPRECIHVCMPVVPYGLLCWGAAVLYRLLCWVMLCRMGCCVGILW